MVSVSLGPHILMSEVTDFSCLRSGGLARRWFEGYWVWSIHTCPWPFPAEMGPSLHMAVGWEFRISDPGWRAWGGEGSQGNGSSSR